MNRKLRFTAAVSAIAMAGGISMPAFAQDTAAGTDITNNVTVSYQVGGVDQSDETASDTFVVDRKIDLTVAASDSVTTTVAPGQVNDDLTNNPPLLTYVVTNDSNATLDFQLGAANRGNGAAPNGGTDNTDVTDLQIFVDTDGNNIFDPAVDTATFIEDLAQDASVTVFVVADIGSGEVTGNVASVTLTATARETAAGTGSIGAALTEDLGSADDPTAVDTVFADSAGDTDGNRDAAFSAADDFTVAAADITVRKISTVIEDPFNGTSNPKAIPGATVEYCIVVGNAAGAGAAPATGVTIVDEVPANTTFVAGSILLNGTVAGTFPGTNPGDFTCNGDGSAGGSFDGTDVTGTIASVAAGDERTLVFRVTVD
ncbi:MAG: hypothetical protein AAFX04_05605 [Pseudomonadota bacterium]